MEITNSEHVHFKIICITTMVGYKQICMCQTC